MNARSKKSIAKAVARAQRFVAGYPMGNDERAKLRATFAVPYRPGGGCRKGVARTPLG